MRESELRLGVEGTKYSAEWVKGFFEAADSIGERNT
jgi:hypothetical protein